MRDHVFYIKYMSAIVILTAMVFHVQGWTPWNSFLQMIGSSRLDLCWLQME